MPLAPLFSKHILFVQMCAQELAKIDHSQKKATDFKNQWLSNWWAHQDLNLGPKDYEQLQEIKLYTNQ